MSRIRDLFDSTLATVIIIGMLVTSIGSLPFTDVTQAVDAVFRFCPRIPFWPQLPKRSFYERMYVQCLENVPAIVVDEQAETMYVDTRKTGGIERFYENVYGRNLEAFSISDRAAPGFYELLDRLPEVEKTVVFIKAQLVGPFTLGLGLKDENGKPIIYDSAYFDIIKKALRMKAEWLIDAIKGRYPDKGVILFFDEPAMVSFGSAFVSISRADVTALFDEIADGLGAIVGVHCCGNTDWPVLLNSKIDVINYDAFTFMDTIFYFRENLDPFLSRGGRIAPGVVPSTAETLATAGLTDMRARWLKYQRLLSEMGIDQKEQIVTTACGLGSLGTDEACKALDLLKGLAHMTDDH
jgi:methionine synthase II (cobalamin-independent)